IAQLERKDDVVLVGLGHRGDAPSGLNVRFVGNVEDESQVATYLRAADAVVVPSIAENAPLTIIEALMCGTPVVAFAVGGIPEMVNAHNGALVTERTAEALAQGLGDV